MAYREITSELTFEFTNLREFARAGNVGQDDPNTEMEIQFPVEKVLK